MFRVCIRYRFPIALPSNATRSFSGSSNEPHYDVVVVGGGIVGAATARELAGRHPHLTLAVLEKEKSVGVHQSGHNSGVIHAGIYYKPGSLKAKLCVEGMHMAYEYCDQEGIPYRKCGKLIVAVDDSELDRLDELHERSKRNNVPDVVMLDAAQIKEIAPNFRGVRALWSPHTGIVDWGLVTEHYARNFVDRGGTIHTDAEVLGFESNKGDYPVRINMKNKSVVCRYVLTCGGLQSDRLAKLTGCSSEPRILPFRGEYLLLCPEKSHLVTTNIYPVPDPRFPFLGVHFTPRMNGDIWLGPNAILALKREGYKWSDISIKDTWEALTFRGFQRLAIKFVSFGLKEVMRSAFPRLQVAKLQEYMPDITAADIRRGPAGVRAQALNADGSLEDDFVFSRGDGVKDADQVASRVLHCRNAPSPGATSSLAIAKMIADKCREEFVL
ncbi:L-2-hydroxyglutarate dehydrogenase, mitochondrial [Hyalella azteca]|uniref:L-2-hydroxyglutarate dehydrogenase, mitochondrial n=1 Tax=Hyalella azteca TaxID=294128 RepID=A0A8B7NBE4_HYAAZ|nr:L-2-hydroxyglutarate dehydrogenase, mitochondrial [Hyalella azteca]